MEITISKFAGFCGGVQRAYDMVMGIDMEKVKKPVFVLGDLVHNKEVVRKIEEKGIGIIGLDDFFGTNSKEIGTLIITAHGDGPQIFEEAKKKNIDIIDATCPNVAKLQRLAQAFAKRGNQVVLVGDKNHKEVRGIFDWGMKRLQIVSDLEEVGKLKLDPKNKIVVISQTTQEEEKVRKICEKIKETFNSLDIELADTICLATEDRQGEIKEKAGLFEVVIVIGDNHSANSKRLFEIAKNINPKTFFIQKTSQLDEIDFAEARSILITAGASTPNWLIKEVSEKLKQKNS